MSILKQRAELLEQLIESTANLTPGHPQYDAVARSCKETIDFHSFLDTHPDVVTAEYARLKERIDDNAQFDKVTALGLLIARLKNLNFASSQLDFSSRQLSFLLAASRNVLRTVVDPEILAQGDGTEINDNGNAARAIHPSEWTDEEDDSDAEWWANEVAYSPEDGLSAWSGEEDEDEEERLETKRTAGNDSLTSTHEGGGIGSSLSPSRGGDGVGDINKQLITDPTNSPLTPLAISRTAHRSPTRHHHRHVSPQRRGLRQPYGATSLSVWLAAKDSGGHPARQLDPRRCFTDKELVIQVINMLKGLQMPGLAFKFDADSASYRVSRGVHTPDLPPTSTASLLTAFTFLATHLRRIQTFCDAIVFTSAEMNENNNISNTIKELRALPTVAAFAASVARQVVAIRGQLLDLETSATFQGQNDSINNINLLSLRLRLAVMHRQINALHALVKECYWRGTAPCTAAALLDTLYFVLETHLMRSGQHDGAVSAMLAEIFCAAWKPLNDALDNWLSSGSLTDAPPEFYISEESTHQTIQAGSTVDCTSGANSTKKESTFWSDKYKLQRWSGKGEEQREKNSTIYDSVSKSRIAAPALIAPLAESLLYAGLASVGLTLSHLPSSASDPRASSSTSTNNNNNNNNEASSSPLSSLHSEFVQSLGALITRGKDTTASTTHETLLPATATDRSKITNIFENSAIENGYPTTKTTPVTANLEETGLCVKEWTAAVSRSPTTALVPLAEDISDLSLFPSSALELPTAFMCPENTALVGCADKFYSSSTSGTSVFDRIVSTGRIEEESMNRHPVAAAMHLASSARAKQAAAGKPASLVSAEFDIAGGTTGSTGNFNDVLVFGQREGGEGRNVARVYQTLNLSKSTQYSNTPFFSSQRTTMTTRALAMTTEKKHQIPLDAASWAASLPLEVLTDISLVDVIYKRMKSAEKRACEAVLQAGLLSQLTTMETVAAAAGPVLDPFVQYLLRNSSTPRGVDGLSPFELNTALADALLGTLERQGEAALPGLSSLSVAIAPPAPPAQGTTATAPPTTTSASSGVVCSVSSLNRVILTLRPCFPLNLIATDSFLKLHTTLWTLSLQLQWVAQSLIAARVALWKESQNQNSSNSTNSSSTANSTAKNSTLTTAAQQEMLHLVHAVRQHMLTHVSSTSVRMRRGVAKCRSLREIGEICRKYEDELRQGCFVYRPTSIDVDTKINSATGVDGADAKYPASPPSPSISSFSSAALQASLLEILESSLRHCILLGHARQATAVVKKAAQAQLDAEDAEQEAFALDSLEQAEQRLSQVYSAVKATEREFEQQRVVFMQLVSEYGNEAGAHSDAARALLAAVDVGGRWQPKVTSAHSDDNGDERGE